MADASDETSCTPLFTRAELAAAFGLLLPSAKASELAGKWFEVFGDDDRVDEEGRYLYIDRRYDQNVPETLRSGATVVFSRPKPGLSLGQGMYDWILSMSREALEERLISFSDIHLDLIALSSPELRARVETVRSNDDPRTDTETRYRELQRVVDQIEKRSSGRT